MQRLDVRVIRFALSEQRIKDFSNKWLQSRAGSHLNEGTHSDLSVIPVYRYYKCGEFIMVNFGYLININVPGLQQLLRKIRVHKRSSEQKQDLQQLHNFQFSLPPAAFWHLLALKRPAPVGGVELKLLRPFKERSRSEWLQRATVGEAFHVFTSNSLFMSGKVERDGAGRINDKSRSEIQLVSGHSPRTGSTSPTAFLLAGCLFAAHYPFE